MNLELLKRDIVELEDHIAKSQRALDFRIEDLKNKCNHPHDQLRECEFKDLAYYGSYPPMRVCMFCGTWEDGWGCGYKILKSESKLSVPIIPREEVYELRRMK
jgi:hypothetical protein